MQTANTLLELYNLGLNAVKGDNAVYNALMAEGTQPACHVVAIGKAAEAMYQGVVRYLEKDIKSALLISKYGHFSPELLADRKLTALEAAHPVPAESSLLAGQTLIQYLQQLPKQEPVLFLISGGASSLCEVLEEGWTLEKLQAATQEKLANGATIAEINAMRKQLSKIKGGKLWNFMSERPASCLLISDVQGDDPAVIGSGLLFPVPTERAFTWQIVASNQQLLSAIQCSELANIQIMPEFLQGSAEQAAKSCVEFLKQQAAGIYVWGGETTVQLPDNPGRGGRNQHFALVAALELVGTENITMLCAATDGSDGVTEDAGALVDAQSVERGALENLDANDCLKRADAGTFLAASGDLLNTGPTGTNVMDLVIALKS
jgi:hydroxypyruvate reductase